MYLERMLGEKSDFTSIISDEKSVSRTKLQKIIDAPTINA